MYINVYFDDFQNLCIKGLYWYLVLLYTIKFNRLIHENSSNRKKNFNYIILENYFSHPKIIIQRLFIPFEPI